MSNLSKILIGVIILLTLILIYETAFLLRLQHINTINNDRAADYSFKSILPNWKQDPYSRINPFREFNDFHNSLLDNSFFDDFFEDSFRMFDKYSIIAEPEISLSETKESYIVKANVPGVLKNNIKVEVEGNTLSLSGSYEIKDKNNQQTGSFYKAIPLPGEVKVSDVKTEYKNGLLIITLPKKTPGLKIKPEGDVNLI